MLHVFFAICILVVFIGVLAMAFPVDLTGAWLLMKSDYSELSTLIILLGGSFTGYL